MTKKTRKKYTPEFRQDAVRLVMEQGYTRAAAVRSLGVDAGMLGRWVREYQESEEDAFRGNGNLAPAEFAKRYWESAKAA